MRISPVACLYFLLLGSSAFAQLSRRDLEDIERHRGESREMSVVVETWDFLDVDEEEATPEEIDVGAGAVLEYFWESPDSLLATMVADYIARHKKGLRIVLERYEFYEDELRAVFERKGLPEDLTLLAAVESAMNPRALSKAGARGMWQLMPATARQFGLRCDGFVDDRLDDAGDGPAVRSPLRRVRRRPAGLPPLDGGCGVLS